MAGMGPGAGAPGMMGGMPGPMMGTPPPMAPPPMAPQAPPPNPLAGALPGGIDLTRNYPPEYQLLDLASQMVQTALDTGGFIDEPDVRAHVVSVHGSMKRLLEQYDAGRAAAGPPAPAGPVGDAAPAATEGNAVPDDTDAEPDGGGR